MDDGNAGEDESYFAKQGKNPSRVKEVLKHHQCCKGNCKRLLPFKLLMHMVTIFWSMPKASQDCVLWAMQQRGAKEFDPNDSSSSSSSRHQISWSIEGLLSWLSGIKSFFHEVLNSQWLAWEATLYAGKPSWSCWASVQHALSELGRRLKELMLASLVSLQIIIRVWCLNSIIYICESCKNSVQSKTRQHDFPNILGSIGRASAEASASITSFLETVYWSMSETLPHE